MQIKESPPPLISFIYIYIHKMEKKNNNNGANSLGMDESFIPSDTFKN